MGLGSMHVQFPGRGGPDLLSTPRPEHVLNKYKIFRAFVQVDVFWWMCSLGKCWGGRGACTDPDHPSINGGRGPRWIILSAGKDPLGGGGGGGLDLHVLLCLLI